MFFLSSGEWRMVWQHVVFPFLYQRKRSTLLDFLQHAVYEMGQLAIRPISVPISRRLLYDEIVVVWNIGIPLSTKFAKEGATRNKTSWLLEIPSNLAMRIPLGMLHVDSYKLQTEDACVTANYYTIMTDDVKTNTFRG